MDHVKQALMAMYSPSATQAQKKEATVYLESFQKSPEAWEIVHTILADVSSPLEYRMFASQTLRSKATYDLSQLPEDSYTQLKDSMLNLLSVYATKEKLIRTQLSLALSQLALQYLHWDSAIDDITSRLSSPEALPAMLEFLKSLPEELTESNKTPLTDEEFDLRTKQLITNNVLHVLLLLKSLVESDCPHQELMLGCLNSWIKECPIEDVLKVDVLASLIFKSLTDPNTFDQAAECLCSVLKETRDVDNYQLIDALYQQLLHIHEFYSKNGDLEDPELLHGLTRIYAEAGESWHVLIAKNAAHFKPLVQILLQCAEYKEDLDVVKYTFYFWYQLRQMLTLPRFEESKKELQPIYLDLIRVIIKHLRYPQGDNLENLFDGDKEQEDKFKDFRYEMGDVLKDCCAVVGPQKALNIPFQEVQTLITQPGVQWQALEAPLFGMRVMAQAVPTKENRILPAIMQMLVQLPEHPKLRYATTLVLGRYSEWTAKNPEYLEVQLNYITAGFRDAESTSSEIINATAQALMYFCQDCAQLLVNYWQPLLMLYQKMQARLSDGSSHDVVKGLSHVIKEMPAADQFMASEMFLGPTLRKLTDLCQNSENISTASQDVVSEAEIISIFMSVLRCSDIKAEEYPIATYFTTQVWPVITQALGKFGSVLKISEVFCKVMKNAIQSCTWYLTPILESMGTVIHEGFKSTYFGCFLWVTGVLIQNSEDFSEGPSAQTIYAIAISQSESFLELIRNHDGLDIRDIPDVIEDFFSMASDLLMFLPTEVILNEQLTASFFEAGISALKVSEEINPLMSCIHFFIDYLSWGTEYPPVSFFEGDHEHIRKTVQAFMALDMHGPKLTQVVLNGLIYKFYNNVDGNDLLIKILTVTPNLQLTLEWLRCAVTGLPNVSEKEVTKLMGAISVALPNKDTRRVRMSIKDFVSWYTRKNVNTRAAFQ